MKLDGVMIKKTCYFALLLCVSISVSHAGKIWLENGDQFSGDIISLEKSVLRIDSSTLGAIAVPWESVVSLESDTPLSIVLTNGDRLSVAISRSDGGQCRLHSGLFGEIDIFTQDIKFIGVESISEYQSKLNSASESINDLSSDLSASHETVKKLQDDLSAATDLDRLWSGSVSMMAGGKMGNRDSVDAYVKSKLKRATEKEELTLKADFGYGETEKVVDTIEGRFNSNLRVFFTKKNYVYGDLLLEHDRFEDLELRVDGTVGSGYRFWKNSRSEFLSEVGAGFTQEIYRNGGDQTEAILRFAFEYSQMFFEKSKFSQSFVLYPSVGQLGEFRVISQSTLLTPIWDSFSWDISLTDEYDSEPNPGVDSNDISFRTGLTYSF